MYAVHAVSMGTSGFRVLSQVGALCSKLPREMYRYELFICLEDWKGDEGLNLITEM